MADNVTSNAGSGGPTWATNDIGGIQYPRMKISHGAPGSATDTSTAAPLPVVQTGTPALPAGAATEATLAALSAKVPASPATDRATAAAPFAVRLSDGAAFLASLPVSGTFWQATQPVSFTWAGLTDAQLRATAVAVSVASLPLPSGAATAANQTTGNGSLSSIDGKLPSALTPGLLPVDVLGTLGVSRQLAAGATSANTALTTTCRRVSIHANGAAIRFAIGTGSQTASATSHYIASGERLDLDVPANAQIGVIRAGATDAVLEVSELV